MAASTCPEDAAALPGPEGAEPPPDLLAFGEPMVEYNQTGEGGGRLYLQGFGGDTSNFAVAAARQGARVGCIGALGDDAHGAMLRALWQAEGVDARAVRTDPQAPTGIYFVTHHADGHRFGFLRAGSAASRYRAEDLPEALIRSARALHLSSISMAISPGAREACRRAVALAREAGLTVCFDTNLRLKLWDLPQAREALLEMLRHVDVCLPSLDDVVQILGIEDPDRIADRCLELGARVVALKLGARGTLLADASTRLRIPPFPCRPVDATGAGDAFGGAFLARLLAGDSLEEAGRHAACAAALSTEGFGAVAPIPTAQRVRAAREAVGGEWLPRPQTPTAGR